MLPDDQLVIIKLRDLMILIEQFEMNLEDFIDLFNASFVESPKNISQINNIIVQEKILLDCLEDNIADHE